MPSRVRSLPLVLALVGCKVDAPPAAPKATPEIVQTSQNVLVDLALGHARACGVRVDGRVVCWGGWYGEAPAPPAEPTLVPALDDVAHVTGDDLQWCALRRDGEVRCFGKEMVATQVVAKGVTALSANGCARFVDGHVECRDGTSRSRRMPGLDGAIALSKGSGGATCAVRSNETVACWGPNNFHQLGDGTTLASDTPVNVLGVADVVEVSASYFFGTCARHVDGTVTCWGGELNGEGAPKKVVGLTHVEQIALAEYHACARHADGTVHCWGANDSAQLGAKDAPQDAPFLVPGVKDAIDVEVGHGEPCGGCGSTCVRTRAGALLCWGAINGAARPTPVDLSKAK